MEIVQNLYIILVIQMLIINMLCNRILMFEIICIHVKIDRIHISYI